MAAVKVTSMLEIVRLTSTEWFERNASGRQSCCNPLPPPAPAPGEPSVRGVGGRQRAREIRFCEARKFSNEIWSLATG
jgi:hypothetical protein